MLIICACATIVMYFVSRQFRVTQQVGNFSAHALQFAHFMRKGLEASKYSNLLMRDFVDTANSDQNN
jgi:hypothetical protein